MCTDATDLQEMKKSGAVLLRLDIFYPLILAADIVIYLSFAIINGNLLKKVAVTAPLLQ